MDNERKVKPTRWKLCIICGERVADGQDLVGGQMRRGGIRCAHKSCWEKEQAERAEEVTPCPKRSKKK